MVIWAGQTDARALIILNLYLLPGVMVKVSKGVLVLNPVLGSCNRIAKYFTVRCYLKKRLFVRTHRELSFAIDQ